MTIHTKHLKPTPLVLLLAAALLLPACGTKHKQVVIDYETIPQRADRDTERARRANAEAIDLTLAEKYDEAEKHAKRALTHDVAFGPAHNTLGLIYYRQQRYYLAAWEFQYATKLMPNHPEPRNNLGLVLEAVGKYDQAIAEYDKALSIEPDNVEVIGNLARAHVRAGDRNGELRDLLQQLVMKDTRAEWQSWAREKLAFLGTLVPPPPAPGNDPEAPE